MTWLTWVVISASSNGVTVNTSLLVRPGGENLNLSFQKHPIEVTQAIQCLDDGLCADNALPLVKGKTTVVRIYPEVEGVNFRVSNVRGTLASRPCGTSEWTYDHQTLWPTATISPTMDLQEQRASPISNTTEPHNLTFLVDRKYLDRSTRKPERRSSAGQSTLIQTSHGGSSCSTWPRCSSSPGKQECTTMPCWTSGWITTDAVAAWPGDPLSRKSVPVTPATSVAAPTYDRPEQPPMRSVTTWVENTPRAMIPQMLIPIGQTQRTRTRRSGLSASMRQRCGPG